MEQHEWGKNQENNSHTGPNIIKALDQHWYSSLPYLFCEDKKKLLQMNTTLTE